MSNGFIVAVPVTKTSRGYFLYAHWSKAPAFAFYEVYNGKYRLIEVVDNPLKDVEGRGKGKFLLDLILSRKAQAVIVYSIGGGAFEWDSSEQAWHLAGYVIGGAYYNAKKFEDGYELTVKVKSTGGSVGLFLKFQDSSNYLLFMTDQNNWKLVSMINDASSTLASTVYPINLLDYKEWKVLRSYTGY